MNLLIFNVYLLFKNYLLCSLSISTVYAYLYEFIIFQRLFALKNSLLCSLSISTVYASMTVT